MLTNAKSQIFCHQNRCERSQEHSQATQEAVEQVASVVVDLTFGRSSGGTACAESNCGFRRNGIKNQS
jgi:hypothetical protein